MSETKFQPGPLTYECGDLYDAERNWVGSLGFAEGWSDRSRAALAYAAHATQALPPLIEALKEWVTYFDQLARDDEPGDRLADIRNQYHGERLDRSREAIARAEQGKAI